LLAAEAVIGTAMAGPPFRTDDPDPVETEHWEVDLFSQGTFVALLLGVRRPFQRNQTVPVAAKLRVPQRKLWVVQGDMESPVRRGWAATT
jgi:hypothetical protein